MGAAASEDPVCSPKLVSDLRSGCQNGGQIEIWCQNGHQIRDFHQKWGRGAPKGGFCTFRARFNIYIGGCKVVNDQYRGPQIEKETKK